LVEGLSGAGWITTLSQKDRWPGCQQSHRCQRWQYYLQRKCGQHWLWAIGGITRRSFPDNRKVLSSEFNGKDSHYASLASRLLLRLINFGHRSSKRWTTYDLLLYQQRKRDRDKSPKA
jgi:hypothetical protein